MIPSDLVLNDNAKGLNDSIFEYTPGLVKKRYKRCTKCRGFGHSVTVCPNKRVVTLGEARQIDQMLEAKRLEHNLNALIREHEEEKRAAQEQYFELSKSTFQVLNTSKGEVLDSSPIFDSYEEQSEPLLNLFPKDHGVEVDEERAFDPYPTHDLFHDAPIDHEICELNDPPIFDSYELEIEEVNSFNGFTNEVLAESRGIGPNSNLLRDQIESSTSILIRGPFFLFEEVNSGSDHGNSDLNMLRMNLISPVATQNEQLEASAAPSSYFLAQSGPTGYYADAANNISSFKSSEQSKKNSFKNCYAFKKKGVLSEAELQPGVHLDQVFVALETHKNQVPVLNQFLTCTNASSVGYSLYAIYAELHFSSMLHHKLKIRTLEVYGFGLLDYYIEDDELKDDRGLLLLHSAYRKDLRSNLHQPGVYDAGASSITKPQ